MTRKLFFKFWFCLLFFLIHLSTFASSPFFYSLQKDAAAVMWVPYDGNKKIDGKDKGFFKESAALNGRVFCSSQSVFKVPEENCFIVPFDASLLTFESQIKYALNQIRLAKEPVLFVSIDSEGVEGQVGRQEADWISHKDLLDAIFNPIGVFETEIRKKLTLKLFINTCYSHSILPALKNRIEGKYGIYKNESGGPWYEYKVDLFTSSDAEKKSFGNEFLKCILEVAKNNNNHFDENDWPLFCSKDIYNSHHIWSSYCSYSKIALRWIIEAMNSYLVFHDPQLEAEVLNEMKSVSVYEVYDVVTVLEAHASLHVRVAAANLLARLGATAESAVPHLEKIILNKKEGVGMRVVSVIVLGKIGLGVSGVREALEKAMRVEGEGSEIIHQFAKKELGRPLIDP